MTKSFPMQIVYLACGFLTPQSGFAQTENAEILRRQQAVSRLQRKGYQLRMWPSVLSQPVQGVKIYPIPVKRRKSSRIPFRRRFSLASEI